MPLRRKLRDGLAERGEDRVLVDGQWVEVPTYLNARRLLGQG